MTGILLGLVAACGWGVVDFYGGVVSRRWPPLWVVLCSMCLAALSLLVVILLRGAAFVFGDDGYWAMAAGTLGVFSLTGFFRLLARGNMAVSAPITALTTAIIPVLFGILRSGLPASTQLLGIFTAFIAIPLVARGSENVPLPVILRNAARTLWEPILVGIGFGLGLICMDQIDAEDLLAPLFIQRMTSISLLLLILWLRPGLRRFQSVGMSPLLSQLRPVFIYLWVIAYSDLAANGAFILATQRGELSIVAVIGSLHPAITVLMAHTIDNEQLHRAQTAGLALALVAIVLISLRCWSEC